MILPHPGHLMAISSFHRNRYILYTGLVTCLSICLTSCFSICLSTCLTTCLSICLLICLYFHPALLLQENRFLLMNGSVLPEEHVRCSFGCDLLLLFPADEGLTVSLLRAVTAKSSMAAARNLLGYRMLRQIRIAFEQF